MNQAGGAKKVSCLGALVILGSACLVPLSLAVSGVYGSGARNPDVIAKQTTDAVLEAIWVVAIAAVALTLLWVWSAIRRTPRSGRRKLAESAVIVAVLIGPAGWAANSVSAGTPQMDAVHEHPATPTPTAPAATAPVATARTYEVLAAIEAACVDRMPDPSAPPYLGDVHPLVITWRGIDDQGDLMAGQTVSAVQLAACIGEENFADVGVFCSYDNGAQYPLEQRTATISVVVIATGQVIGATVLKGGFPTQNDCPNFVTEGQTGFLAGPDYSHSDLWSYLLPFVHGSPLPSALPTH